MEQNCIKPLCDLLNISDTKIIHVALDALDNILRVGQDEYRNNPEYTANPYAIAIEECFGEW